MTKRKTTRWLSRTQPNWKSWIWWANRINTKVVYKGRNGAKGRTRNNRKWNAQGPLEKLVGLGRANIEKAPYCDTRKSERRGTLGEIMRSDWMTKLDFRKKEKNATKKKARMAAWIGWLMSCKETVRKSRVGVMGSLRAGVAPKKRLHPRNTSWKEYELSHTGGKPNKRWKCLILEIWSWTVP